jgi:hypothetical protein
LQTAKLLHRSEILAGDFFARILKKFLICSFCYARKEKSTGQKRPDQNPQSASRFAGFCVWGQMKVMMMQRHKDRPIRRHHRRMMTGGWKSHYGGFAPVS